MVSKANEENRLILATSFGNNDLICNGDDESSKVLRYGLKIDEQMHVTSNMMKSISKSPWSNDYHSFVLTWTPKNIAFQIDGESNFLDTSNLPMDVIFESEVRMKKCYILRNVKKTVKITFYRYYKYMFLMNR